MITAGFDVDFKGFEAAVMADLKGRYSASLAQLIVTVREPVLQIIETEITGSDEYLRLVSGDLRQQFGLSDPVEAVGSVIAAIKEAAVFTALPAEADDFGSIFIGAFQEDFSDAVNAAGASYGSRGGDVDWVLWYLTKGGSLVISDFRILINENGLANSRAGNALMVKGSPLGWQAPEGGADWMVRVAKRGEALVVSAIEEILGGL